MSSENKNFRLGIIGAGIFAEANHFPSLATHFFDDVDRVAVCDLRIERAQRMAGRYGWQNVYTDYRAMIEKESLDAVIVCLGAKNHPAVAADVLKRGVPVFLEKPSSCFLDGTKEIREASERGGVPVQVGHQKRYSLAYERARSRASATDSFGTIVQIESKMHGFPVFPTFYTCMLEWQCHNLDLVISFGGPIRAVEAMANPTGPRTGGLVAMLRFESGAIGQLAWGTFGGPGQFAERIEIVSDKGNGVIVENARDVVFYDPEVGERFSPDWNPISKNQSHVFNGYVRELRSFIDSIRDGKVPVPSIMDEEMTMYWLGEIAQKAGVPLKWEFISSEL